jgi:hypothetical protein
LPAVSLVTSLFSWLSFEQCQLSFSSLWLLPIQVGSATPLTSLETHMNM